MNRTDCNTIRHGENAAFVLRFTDDAVVRLSNMQVSSLCMPSPHLHSLRPSLSPCTGISFTLLLLAVSSSEDSLSASSRPFLT